MKNNENAKSEFECDTNKIEQVLTDDQGLLEMIKGSYRSGMRRWMILINIVIIAVSIVMVWTGYRFFTAGNLEGYVYWGVCLLLSAYAQIAMKQWVWMEMSRTSLMREIKRVELEVARLSEHMKASKSK